MVHKPTQSYVSTRTLFIYGPPLVFGMGVVFLTWFCFLGDSVKVHEEILIAMVIQISVIFMNELVHIGTFGYFSNNFCFP